MAVTQRSLKYLDSHLRDIGLEKDIPRTNQNSVNCRDGHNHSFAYGSNGWRSKSRASSCLFPRKL